MKLDRLSNCELEVMKILWEHEGGVSPGEIKQELKGRKNREYEKSTVATWLLRLKKKGWIESVPFAQGKKGVGYIPLVKKEDYEQMEIHLLAERLYEGSLSRTVAAFAQREQLTEKDVKEIREIINGYRR